MYVPKNLTMPLSATDCHTFCPIESFLNNEMITTNNIDSKTSNCTIAQFITKLSVQGLVSYFTILFVI